jgi:hypothetical protein
LHLTGCGADPSEGLGRASHRLTPADAQHALPVRLEQRLALGVVGARERIVVPGGAAGGDGA